MGGNGRGEEGRGGGRLERGRDRREREKGSEGIGGRGGSERRMVIAHPLFSA